MNVCDISNRDFEKTKIRLALLRERMAELDLDAFIVPSSDEHLGEYTPPEEERLKWLTGFTGSAGMCIVLKNEAAIFVDGRYTIQVRQQLPADTFEFKHAVKDPAVQWLLGKMTLNSRVGIDTRLHSLAWFREMKLELGQNKVEAIELENNPIDLCWKDKPKPCEGQIMLHKESFTGTSSQVKRNAAAEVIRKRKADFALITQLDSIAWILNIRGNDVPKLPVVRSFVILDKSGGAVFFVDKKKLPKAFFDHVGEGVICKKKEDLEVHLVSLGENGSKISADPKTSNAWCQLTCLKAGADLSEGSDPTVLAKAMKNPTELAGIRKCHLRDGAAVTRFLGWLDNEVKKGFYHDEKKLADELERYRTELKHFQGLSFDTISAAGANAALAHYNYLNGTPSKVESNNLYLVDSGGQYLDGTTDITRTVAIGKPKEEHRRMFTLVLKGHIALADAVFPEGTTGANLDVLARQYLWKEGLDYDHGTGHGVGAFLSVHEGPQGISRSAHSQELIPGMIISNEPGFYKEGEYGIRCENLVVVVENSDSMLSFETISFAPFDISLIDLSILSEREIHWINSYHESTKEKLAPFLTKKELDWLKASTKTI